MFKLRSRAGAAVAVAATAGALLPALAFAGPASAAGVTAITVNANQSKYFTQGAGGTISGTYASPVGALPKIEYALTSGTNATRATAGNPNTGPFAGFPCTLTPNAGAAGGSFVCTLTAAQTAQLGNTTATIFDDANNDNAFQSTEVNTTFVYTVVGPIQRTDATPTSANVATATWGQYTTKSIDQNSNPASGTVQVTAVQTVPLGQNPNVRIKSPVAAGDSTTFPATGGNAGVLTSATATTATYTATNTVTVTDGAGSFEVASDIAGTVAITVGQNTASQNATTASLTVSQGNTANPTTPAQATANNNNASATGFTVTPGDATGITNGSPVQETVTVKDAAGDALGGVTVSQAYSGNNQATQTGVTNAKGQVTFNVTAATAAGNVTVSTYVEQSKNASNVPGPNAGEPQQTNTIAFSNLASGATVDAPSAKTVASTTASVPVTFNVTYNGPNNSPIPLANQAITFSIASNPAAAGYTLQSASGTTDANGQVTATVLNTTASVGVASVTATITGADTAANPTATATATVNFVQQSATNGAITVTPAVQTAAVGGTISVTAKATDNLGQPLANDAVTFTVTGRNNAANNTGTPKTVTTDSSGNATFTYTDNGSALTANATDNITASDANGNSGSATVKYIAGTNKANNVTFITPVGNTTSSTTAAGTAQQPTTARPVQVEVRDANGVALAGKAVTFTINGVGYFTNIDSGGQSQGIPAGQTTTVTTDANGVATVYVASQDAGTQRITATADGISASITITYNNSGFNKVDPQRLADTRTGQGAINGSTGASLAANTAYTFDLTRTIAPRDAEAYVFNVTAVGPTTAGNLRIGPANRDIIAGPQPSIPATSLINYQVGQTTANLIVVPNGAITLNGAGNGGPSNAFSIYTDGSPVHVVIDLQGYYTSGFAQANGDPQRVVQGTNVAANSAQSLSVVPAVQTGQKQNAVALNVTAVQPSGAGNLRVYGSGTTPTASNINYIPGVDKAGFVIVTPAADGTIQVYSDGSAVKVIVDRFGIFANAGQVAQNSPAAAVNVTPKRVLDTRTGSPLAAGTSQNATVTGDALGVPTNAQAVIVSLTAVHRNNAGVGNLRAYPAGIDRPQVSNINYIPGADIANLAIVPVGANGQISVYSEGSDIDALVDVVGYIPLG